VPRIEVQYAGLAAAARALHAAAEVAGEVHRGARTLRGAAVATGVPLLAEAAEDFREAWAYGLDLVVGDTRTLARLLDEADRAYAAADQAVARGCGP
jgi:hypothetical protein